MFLNLSTAKTPIRNAVPMFSEDTRMHPNVRVNSPEIAEVRPKSLRQKFAKFPECSESFRKSVRAKHRFTLRVSSVTVWDYSYIYLSLLRVVYFDIFYFIT